MCQVMKIGQVGQREIDLIDFYLENDDYRRWPNLPIGHR